MNNKALFYEWLKIEKNYSPRELKFKQRVFEGLNHKYKFFELTNINAIKKLNIEAKDKSIELYYEFIEGLAPEKESEDEVVALFNDMIEENAELKGISINISDEDTQAIMGQSNQDETDKIVKEFAFSDFQSECIKAEDSFVKMYSLAKEEKVSSNNNPKIALDIVTGRFYDINNNIVSSPMVSYSVYGNSDGTTKKYPRNINSFYYDSDSMAEQVSVVGGYYNDTDVIKMSIDDTITILSPEFSETETKKICIVPDSAGDFNDKIKTQIKGSSYRLIQIPRSVIAAYSYIDFEKVDSDEEYTVYDFDAEKFTKTLIRIEYDSEIDSYNIVRYGRRTFEFEGLKGFSSLAELYVEEYSKKHLLTLKGNITNNLIITRDILKIVCDKESILVKNNGKFVTINYDEEIIRHVCERIAKFVENEDDHNPIVILGIHSGLGKYISVDDMEFGCQNVFKRIENGKIIYKEFLPELSLEVIRNGTFDVLELISKKNPPQAISEASMDEEVNIPIENGRFVFMAGRDKLYCPLTREEFGENKKGDKLAMFYEPKIFPLSEPVEVELSLKYRYGDPDSYRLIATPVNNDFDEITSQWCDDEDRVMGNDVIPEYSKPIIRTKLTEESFNEAVGKTFYYINDAHNYTMGGGRDGEPPFDSFGNWLALKALGFFRLSIPLLFSPQNMITISNDTFNNVEDLLSKLLDIYDDCDNECLVSPNPYYPCDFTKTYYSKIKTTILDRLSAYGGFCSSESSYQSETIDNIVKLIIGTRNLMYILPLSTYVKRDSDRYGIWNVIDTSTRRLVNNGKSLHSLVRGVSAIAWRNSQWIYQFGQLDDKIIEAVITTIFDEFYVSFKELKKNNHFKDDNPRGMRDILEALLALVRLKPCNATVMKCLDCNRKMIKNFVDDLKELDSIAKAVRLEHPFISRIDVEVPENLKNVSSVVYPLIETLSDGNAVKLTGFTED